MKIMVMTDLEGVSGINGKNDHIGNQLVNLPVACQVLVDEVNAVVDGLAAGGADEIVVWDGHGPSNSIDITKLNPPAMLGTIGGALHPVCYCDSTYNGVVQLGAHAFQGTSDGYLCHSYDSHGINNMWLNEECIGEIGMCAKIAAYFHVPTLLVTGDEAACREAAAQIPGVDTVVVKKGLSRYTAINRNPKIVQKELREAAENCVRRIGDFALPPIPHEGCQLRIELKDENIACSYEMRGWERLGPTVVQTSADDIIDVFAQYCGWVRGVHNRKFGITPAWRGLVFL